MRHLCSSVLALAVLSASGAAQALSLAPSVIVPPTVPTLPTVAPPKTTQVPITRFESASFAFGANGLAFFDIDAFEPNFQGFTWNIERAIVTITETIGIQFATSPNFVPTFPSGALPQPYNFVVRATQGFDSLGKPFAEGFTTLNPRSFIATGVASGVGGIATVVIPASYSFRFDASSDLIGGLAFSADGLYQAMRSDFLPSAFSDRIRFLTDIDVDQLTGLAVTPVGFFGGGSMLIQYDGVLELAEGQAPPEFLSTPVPAALPLMLTALGGLGLLGRRRRQGATTSRS